MTKIAIISQPEQGVLIDVGGCTSLQEATQHLTCTLQVSSQFWEDQPIDLNLGTLSLNRDELGQILSILAEVGLKPRHVFARSAATKAALRAFNIVPASGQPASLPGAQPGEEDAATSDEPAPVAAAGDRDTMPVAKPPKKQSAKQATTAGADNTAVAVEERAIPAAVEERRLPAGITPDAEPSGLTPAGTDEQAMDGIAPTPAATELEAETTEDAPLTFEPGEAEAPKEPAKPVAPHVMYLRQTLRSGQAISHKGHLVIVGDVNPGAEVIAEGDITIWGALRGIAHAGVAGNTNAEIRALRFEPIQLRIAHAIARSPDRPRGTMRSNGPETARIVNDTIRISISTPD